MNTYFYTVDDMYGPYEFKSVWDHISNPEWLAEDAAEDFFHGHDGWEHKWPLKFTIQNGYIKPIVFEIDMEPVPSFDARKI